MFLREIIKSKKKGLKYCQGSTRDLYRTLHRVSYKNLKSDKKGMEQSLITFLKSLVQGIIQI